MTDQLCIAIHHHEPDRPRLATVGLLCVGHASKLRDQLLGLPNLHEELTAALANGWRDHGEVVDEVFPLVPVGPRVTAAEHPLPIDPDVADLREAMERSLWGFGVMVNDDMGGAWPGGGIELLGPWLLDRLDYIVWQEWCGDLIEELGPLIGKARAKLAPPRHRTFLGPCEAGGDCEETLWAVRGDDGLVPVAVECEACGAVHDVGQRLAWATHADRAGTAREMSRVTEIPWGTVRSWISRGTLRPAGQNSEGKALYTVEAVLACRTRQKEEAVQHSG